MQDLNILNMHYTFSCMHFCLLYTSDAADDMQCVDLGGRRIIKKVITYAVMVQCMFLLKKHAFLSLIHI